MPIIPYVYIEDLQASYTERGYVAPTVFLKAGTGMPGGWNYYSSSREVIDKILYLKGAGGFNVAPAGSVQFQRTGIAQTMGINVDFYVATPGAGWVPTGYKWIKDNYSRLNSYAIYFRFYTTYGQGPYYAIFEQQYFGASAIVIKDIETNKLQALDEFYREVQRLKYRYNSLVAFQNELAKLQLSPAGQQIFNAGTLKLQAMANQISTIKGIEISYNESGTVGNPVILLILLILIIAGVTAWSITAIQTEKEKTKRINESYDLGKWIAEKKTEVAQMVNQGQISQTDANSIYKTLDKTQATADKVAQNASENPENLFSGLANLVKWVALGFIAIKGIELIQNSQTKKKSAA